MKKGTRVVATKNLSARQTGTAAIKKGAVGIFIATEHAVHPWHWVQFGKGASSKASALAGDEFTPLLRSYAVVTKVAVPGWADKRQRVFEPDGNERKATVERFAKSLGLKKSQYKIVEVSHG